MYKTLTIKNEVGELPHVHSFLKKTGEEFGFNKALLMNLVLVIEEATSNVILYAYESAEVGKTVDLSLLLEKGLLTVTLTDTGVAFDPTAKDNPDISLPAEERPIGGLGIFLIKKIMDEVAYKRTGDKNILTMKKIITNT